MVPARTVLRGRHWHNASRRTYAANGFLVFLRRTITDCNRVRTVPVAITVCGIAGRRGPREPCAAAGSGSGRDKAEDDYESGSSFGSAGSCGVVGADDNGIGRETAPR